jgi:hypothetical protein
VIEAIRCPRSGQSVEGSASLTLRRQLFSFRPSGGVARPAQVELSDHCLLGVALQILYERPRL